MVLCACGHRRPIVLRPLLLVTGASGTGKTTIVLQLAGAFTEAVVLDQDLLWMPEMDTPEDNWRRFRSLWLRLALNIGQSGKPLLLFGSTDPDQYERLPERRYIRSIHTLALVCEDEELCCCLTARPEWRGSGGNEFVDSMLHFNRSLRALAQRQPDRVTLLDTTHDPPNISAASVATWARKILERML
ncbi:MAG: nucleoside kinase [Chloroflexota bacterium]|nr:nucleoside kinase [Chloroflexota bacterium]